MEKVTKTRMPHLNRRGDFKVIHLAVWENVGKLDVNEKKPFAL